MGKLRKHRPKTVKPKPETSKNVSNLQTPAESISTIVSRVISKESDVMSVRSLKSVKSKFGIKKQISKSDKLKIRKEILKQKIDYIKDNVDIVRNKKSKKEKKIDKEPDSIIKTFVKDEDELYLKLGQKKKGILKAKKRKQQTLNDVNTLKGLMKNAKKPQKQ